MQGACWVPPCKSVWAFGHTMNCFGLGEEPAHIIDPWSKDNMDHRGFSVFMDDSLKQERAAMAGLEMDAER
jgi:hypothetical protein